MISTIVSRLVILVFGTLYPAYASYKAVRTKNVKEYVKWMMYWIVFALFTCAETFTDVFLSWFPFYYEIKIILVIWLLSPATKGSSILYRKFVHPMLSRREQEIDDYIAKAKEQGYHTVLNLGTKGVNYATTVIMQTAIKGGGGIVNQLRKSYSLSDLSDNPDARADVRGLPEHSDDERDVVDRHHRRRHSPRRSASGSSRVDMYFPEVDVRQAPVLPHGSHVRSIEDVSSGYSSAEPLYIGQPPKLEAREGLVRTASVGGASTRSRTRTTRTGVSAKKITAATVPEDSEDCESETESSEITIIRRMPKLLHVSNSQSSDESDDADFVDTIGFPLPSLIQTKIEDKTSFISSSPATHMITKPENNTTQTKPIDNKVEDDLIQSSSPVVRNEENKVTNQDEVIIEESFTVKIEDSKLIISENNSVEATISLTSVKESNTNSSSLEIEENHETTSKLDENKEQIEEAKNEPETFCNIQVRVEKQSSIEDVFEDTIAADAPLEEINEKNETPQEITTQKEEIEDTGEYETLNIASSSSFRGGKYNKHTAPTPPPNDPPKSTSNTNENNENEEIPPATPKENETHPIKATLVLKPGIIKSVGPPATEDASKSQIFVSHSPKTKRKTKSESPISRLMMLPKKIFGHKHNSNEDLKRKSWHDDSRSLTPSSVEDVKLSTSDTEGSYEQLVFKKNERHEENKMILGNLSHSPKQFRRKTKTDRNYEDSD